jgi:hypothetical protein
MGVASTFHYREEGTFGSRMLAGHFRFTPGWHLCYY